MVSKSKKKNSISKKKDVKKSPEKEVDITKHYLVPIHIKMDEEEVKELLKRYNIKKKDLPRILIKDPAIRHLNPKPGDVIKIIRKSPTAGEYVYYRVVVTE